MANSEQAYWDVPGKDPELMEYPQQDEGLTRREVIRVLGAGLLISVMPLPAMGQQRRGGGGRGGFGGGGNTRVAARVHIGKDGAITVMTGKVEGGNGARAEITQAAAEELCVPAGRIQLIMADTALVPDDGITAGSRTTPGTIPSVRQGTATAREVLAQLASQKWGVARNAVVLRDGKVAEANGQREISFGELVGSDQQNQAFEQGAPGNVTVTAVDKWKVLGTPIPRPNGRDIVTGTHRYPSDITRPGMLHGKILRAPSYGAKLVSIDLAPAKAMKDVVVVQEGSFVGVAAPTTFAAEQALAAIAKTAKWETAPHPSSKQLFEYLKEHVRGGMPQNPFANEVAAAAKSLHQTYQVAYVQHSPLEPRAAVAEIEDGKVTVWVGSQNPFGCQGEVARALGLPNDRVRAIVPDFGGGFGGKHQADAHVEAARLAKAAGKPVSVRWTRREEFTWAYFRPAALIDIEASLDAQGKLTSWHFVDVNAGGPGIQTPYRTGRNQCPAVGSDSPLRQGSYRCLAATANNFARECFMDEMAAAAGADPLSFRLAHLDAGRLKDVLAAAASKFGFASRFKRKQPGTGVGLACGTEKGSFVAACAEVTVKDNNIIVNRACQAFECGAIMNPANLLSQVQGCVVMGLGPALREGMEFEKGVITNASYWDYLVPRFSDLPELDILLLNRPDLPSAGAGETPLIAIAPAIANAVFHATGQRIRQMPIRLA